MIQFESHFIDKGNYKLHAKRIVKDYSGPVIMLVHGSIENGKIFYSKSGKGLAPFLAEKGFDVFAIDLRGKGKSIPLIDKNSTFGQKEAIEEDIPDFVEGIKSISKKNIEHIGAHSWGGVIVLSYLAKNDLNELKSMVFFGSKRDVRIQSPKKWFNIDLLWNVTGTLLTKAYGYLPAVKYKVGSDNEARNFYYQVNQWVYSKNWIDKFDNFNYAEALKSKDIPPLLSMTGSKDTHSGHPKDVKRLLTEIGNQPSHLFKEIGKANGNKLDYDHINLLTHPAAKNDHFLDVVQWLRNN